MNIPKEFISEIESYNAKSLDGLVEALAETDASVSVRANRGKQVSMPANVDHVPWCGRGWYLPQREAFTFDPAMHQGLYYVQDASSMILSHIVSWLTKEADAPLRYLDACAAPGGKTTAAIDSLPAGSLVVANEYVPTRAAVLRENVIKWGYPGCVVSKGDTARIGKLSGFFDIIAADVPCSGEGMFRKEPDAVSQWSMGLVRECVERQREIVDNIWQALAPGGYFIYSTCTFNRYEDEEMVQYIVDEYGAESVAVPIPADCGIESGVNTAHHCYRFLPHKVKGEGLFVAVLCKPADADVASFKQKKAKPAAMPKIADQVVKTAKQWLLNPADVEFSQKGDYIIAIPKALSRDIAVLTSVLDVIHYGVVVGEIKGKDLIPSQSLAMSMALNVDAFPVCEVDYATAIAYLRREAITLDDAPRGYVIVSYVGKPLGFVKNLGNRANNLYPQEWRILSSHLPENTPKVI